MELKMEYAGVHPRLLFFQKDVEALQNRLEKDAALQVA